MYVGACAQKLGRLLRRGARHSARSSPRIRPAQGLSQHPRTGRSTGRHQRQHSLRRTAVRQRRQAVGLYRERRIDRRGALEGLGTQRSVRGLAHQHLRHRQLYAQRAQLLVGGSRDEPRGRGQRPARAVHVPQSGTGDRHTRCARLDAELCRPVVRILAASLPRALFRCEDTRHSGHAGDKRRHRTTRHIDRQRPLVCRHDRLDRR